MVIGTMYIQFFKMLLKVSKVTDHFIAKTYDLEFSIFNLLNHNILIIKVLEK